MKYVGTLERTEEGGFTVCFENAKRIKEPLNPRNDLRVHSPNGFAWGYMGSGPAQLALAICADSLRRQGLHPTEADERALGVYQRFKEILIATIKSDSFEMTAELVEDVIFGIEKERVK